MRMQSVLNAIDALNKAADALRKGDRSIPEQMNIGMECYRAEAALHADLVSDVPSVMVKAAA